MAIIIYLLRILWKYNGWVIMVYQWFNSFHVYTLKSHLVHYHSFILSSSLLLLSLSVSRRAANWETSFGFGWLLCFLSLYPPEYWLVLLNFAIFACIFSTTDWLMFDCVLVWVILIIIELEREDLTQFYLFSCSASLPWYLLKYTIYVL